MIVFLWGGGVCLCLCFSRVLLLCVRLCVLFMCCCDCVCFLSSLFLWCEMSVLLFGGVCFLCCFGWCL